MWFEGQGIHSFTQKYFYHWVASYISPSSRHEDLVLVAKDIFMGSMNKKKDMLDSVIFEYFGVFLIKVVYHTFLHYRVILTDMFPNMIYHAIVFFLIRP